MKRKRRIIVYIATSADGYIARPNGDVGWLDRPRPKGNYGMGEFLKTIDTILWGRKRKNVWMMGGGGIIASFLDESEIDEVIIHVVPIFIGEGIPLIEPRHRSVQLKLVSSRSYPDGVVRLHYLI